MSLTPDSFVDNGLVNAFVFCHKEFCEQSTNMIKYSHGNKVFVMEYRDTIHIIDAPSS